nr:hypothetical protein [Tanacetum cinerariifolium]
MERFKNAIFKQHEEINDRMTEMFRLLKELTTSRTPEKVLIKEKAKFLAIKNEAEKNNEAGKEEMIEVPSSQPVEYYLKHSINEKLIEGLVDNHRFLALGWNLEETHVTWAHLEKKRKRLRTCTKTHQEVLFLERGDGVTCIERCCPDLFCDGVWILATTSQHSRLKVDLEPSTWRRRQEHKATPELSAAKHKLMLLDTATERRLLLLSQVKTFNEKCCC